MKHGLVVAVAGLILYLLACAGLGKLCLMISPIPLIPLITYSTLKRFTCLCHYGIGVCLGVAPLAAFVGVSGTLDFGADILLLSLFTFCWISAFDIIYALQDIDSDRKNGVHSMPAALGSKGAQIIAAVTHFIGAVAAVWLWVSVGMGILSGVALIVVLIFLCVGYVQSLPLPARFFPTSAVAGIAGALIPLLGGMI